MQHVRECKWARICKHVNTYPPVENGGSEILAAPIPHANVEMENQSQSITSTLLWGRWGGGTSIFHRGERRGKTVNTKHPSKEIKKRLCHQGFRNEVRVQIAMVSFLGIITKRMSTWSRQLQKRAMMREKHIRSWLWVEKWMAQPAFSIGLKVKARLWP